MTDIRFRNILKLIRGWRFPAPAQDLALIILQIYQTEGMESLSQRDLSGGGVVGMGAVVIDRKAAVDLENASVR